MKVTIMMTIMVLVIVSLREGQVTFDTSCRTWRRNSIGDALTIQSSRSVKISIRLGSNSHVIVAGVEGLEPPTSGFGDRRSTN